FHGSLSVHRRAGHTDRFRPRTTQRSPWVRVWTRKATSRPDTVETRVPLFEALDPVCARELSQLRTNRWRSLLRHSQVTQHMSHVFGVPLARHATPIVPSRSTSRSSLVHAHMAGGRTLPLQL